jgi:hypothetical protein
MWLNATAIGVALFLAGYYVWRADHIRLHAAFAIKGVYAQAFTTIGTGEHAMSYYLEVANTSEAISIQDVEVQLVEITPAVENLEWLPVYLRHRRDHSFQGETTFNLNPGKSKFIDFVSAIEKHNQFTVSHIVSGVTNVVVGTDRRRLKVMITGKDVPALPHWFDVYFDSEGFFVCEME